LRSGWAYLPTALSCVRPLATVVNLALSTTGAHHAIALAGTSCYIHKHANLDLFFGRTLKFVLYRFEYFFQKS
jgi:hypothetical protein